MARWRKRVRIYRVCSCHGLFGDFQREIRAGDRFELLYETERDGIDGQRIGGRLHYAALFCRIETSGSFVMTRPMMSSAGMIKRAIRLHEL